MAFTVTPLLTTINAAEGTTTGWSAGVGSADTANQIQGTGCIGFKQSTGVNAFVYNNGSTIDMTINDRHFYAWGLAASSAKINNLANGGVRLRLGTTTANYYEWYVDGSDTYTGGWKCWMINPNDDPDATGGSGATLSQIQYFGLSFNITGTFTGNNLTIFCDVLRYGTGLQVTGSNTTTDVGFNEIFSADDNSSNKYGVISKSNGVFFIKGELVIGNTAASGNPNFSDINSAVVFEDQRVTSTLYKINLVGHASDSTNAFSLGNAIGSGASTIGSKGVTISAAGSATSTGSYTYNNASPATITRSSGSFKTDGLKGGMLLQITGTTNNNKNVVCAKVAATTVTLVSGETLTAEGPVSSTLTGSRRWDFKATDANLKSLKLYGSTFKQAGTIQIGSTSTAFGGSTLALVDNIFSNTRQITKNVTTSSPLYIRNAVNFNTNLTASMNLYDIASIDSTQFKLLQNTGFQTTLSGTQSITISNHDFSVLNTPYITIAINQTWTSVNPTWTVTNQTQLNFGGSTLSGASVDEKFSVNTTVQQTSGSKLQNARVKVVENDSGSGSPALANEGSTDSNGYTTFNTLTRHFVGASSSALTTTTHSGFSLKTFKYAYLPFVGAQTITSSVSPGVTLLPDIYQVETNEATAVSDGTAKAVIVESAALNQSHSIIKWTAGTGTLTAGNTVRKAGGGGASGTLEQIIEGNSTAGTGIVKARNTTAFVNGDSLDNNGGGWSASYTSNSEQRFYWLVQAGTIGGTARSLQQLYDHFQAKLAESPIDTADNWDDVVIDGRAEYGSPIQGVSVGSPNNFKTLRNTTLTHGWVISGLLSLAGLNSYTDNSGNLFAPQSTVNLTITVKNESNNNVQNARVAIFKTSDMTEILNALTDANGQVTTAYTYTSDVPVTIRVRKSSATPKYVAVNTSGTIGPSGLSTTVTFIADNIAAATTNGTISGDALINTTAKIIYDNPSITTTYTINELYTYLMDTFSGSTYMQYPIPMTAQTPSEYTLTNSWYMHEGLSYWLKSGAIQSSGHGSYNIHMLTVTGGTYNDPVSGDIAKTVVAGATSIGPLLDYEIISAGVSAKWFVRDTRGSPAQISSGTAMTITSGTGSGNNSTNSITGECIYSNIFTLGTLLSGTTLDVYQNDSQITPWWSTGQIDIVVLVQEMGVLIDSGNLTVLARKYSTLYDHYVVSAASGRNPVPLAAFNDTNNQTASGTVGASPYTNISITFGHTSQDLGNGNGNRDYDVSINCATLTVAQVYEYLKYVTRHDSTTTLNGVNGEFYTAVGDIRLNYTGESSGPFVQGNAITSSAGGTGYIVSLIDNGTTGTLVIRNVHGTFASGNTLSSSGTGATINGTPESITQSKQAPFGTFAGGKFFGARGVWIYNMNTNDATKYQLTDSTNTIQNPPTTVSVQLTDVIVGSECLIYETGNISNVILLTSAASSTVGTTYNWTGDLAITIRVRKGTSAPKYVPYQATGTITNTGFSLAVSQVADLIA